MKRPAPAPAEYCTEKRPLAANLTTQVRAIAEVATAVTKGDLTRSIQVEAQAEVAALKDNINEMIRNLKDTTLKNAEQDWLKTNLAKFSRMLQGQRDLLTVGRMVLSELAPVVSAQQGVLYVLDGADEAPALRLLASYAHREHAALGGRLDLGDGLIGQCAVDRRKIELRSVPPDYLKIASGLGEAPPLNLVVLPILFEGQVKGVLELASFERFNTMHHAFLDQLTESIGIVLHTIEANTRTEDLLKQSQSLARELQLQQQELQGTNQQLEEKAKLLAEQNVEVERKNTEVEQARQALEEKAKQLALTSKFKSEFLANMSHELRTPLNSLLILSDQLSRNPSGNVTAKQVQFAQTIHASGNDLLTLINDILDLSKIESGTVVVEMEDYPLDHLRTYVDRTFRHVAEAQRLEFSIDIESRLPRSFETDPKRLQQVLKNLLSNAFKFTERGSVSLRVHSARDGWSREHDALNRTRSVLAIAVSDTGIGIPTEKQQIIFEAFQQADGSTSRKYGGTGLGLAISRELTRLLGGELVLQSSPDRGSTFTLFLPQTQGRPRARAVLPDTIDVPAAAATPSVAVATPEIVPVADDDRDSIQQGDRVLLVVDNDLGFASVLLDFGRERGYKALTTAFGAAAIALARQRQPDAITLDICLPDIDGWHVLDRLKHDLATRHIPVFVITTEEDTERAYALGAVGVLTKPVHTKDALAVVFDTLADRSARPHVNLVIIGPDDVARDTLKVTLEDPQLVVHTPRTWDEAKTLLTRERVDCLALDGATCEKALADLSELSTHPNPPIAVFAPEGISKKTERQLRRLAARQAVRVAQSPERLIDDAALLLHRPFETLPEPGRVALERLYRGDAVLAGRTVLIVDDDIRNIFAMTTVLEGCQMTVISAEGGKEGIEKLQQTPGVDIVLMDIMMPDMDGYDTMRVIRCIPAFKALPIVAVTAKAMKGDREKCIEAGAWDYLPKPVDSEQLLSVFRTWLHR